MRILKSLGFQDPYILMIQWSSNPKDLRILKSWKSCGMNHKKAAGFTNLFRLTTWVLYRRLPTDYRFKNKDEKSLKVRFAGLEQFFWKTSDCMNLELRFQVLEPPKLQKRPSGDDPIQVRVHVVWCRLFCLFFVENLLVWSSLGLSRWLRENQWLFDVAPVEFQTHWSGFSFILFILFQS